MSIRRSYGEVVLKKAGAGFIGEELIIRLPHIDDNLELDSCFMCDDSKCKEWTTCEILENGLSVGECYHVSECEMLDLPKTSQ